MSALWICGTYRLRTPASKICNTQTRSGVVKRIYGPISSAPCQKTRHIGDRFWRDGRGFRVEARQIDTYIMLWSQDAGGTNQLYPGAKLHPPLTKTTKL